MALETFPIGDVYTPTVGANADHNFRTRHARFGDNYEQISSDGLNAKTEQWNIAFSNIPLADVLVIKTFLDARGENEAFNWTPPNGIQIIVRMKEGYKETYNATLNVATISTIFRQAFDNN